LRYHVVVLSPWKRRSLRVNARKTRSERVCQMVKQQMISPEAAGDSEEKREKRVSWKLYSTQSRECPARLRSHEICRGNAAVKLRASSASHLYSKRAYPRGLISVLVQHDIQSARKRARNVKRGEGWCRKVAGMKYKSARKCLKTMAYSKFLSFKFISVLLFLGNVANNRKL